MLDVICSRIDAGGQLPAPFTITDWSVTPYPNAQLILTKEFAKGGEIQLCDTANRPLGSVKLSQLLAFDAYLLRDSKSPSTYRQIKKNDEWRMIYGFATRNVTYIINGNVAPKMESSVPCAACGVLLPEKLVSVDHQRAQNSGRPFDSVYKLFKAAGYTEQSPVGAKAQEVLRTYMEKFGGKDSGNNTRTLNPVGVIVFSLFYGSGYKENLQNLCIHHFVNLRPVCVACNSSLGNKL